MNPSLVDYIPALAEQGVFGTLNARTVTVSAPLYTFNQTWNNASVNFIGRAINITNTASGAGSYIDQINVGGSSVYSLTASGSLTIAGALAVTGNASYAQKLGQIFHINNFQYPAPTTGWAPAQGGATLAASLTALKVWLPLNFIKTGDTIVSWNVKGNVVSGGNAVTLDASLYKIPSVGASSSLVPAMTQVNKTANYTMNETITLTTAYTAVAGEAYVVEFTGTTGLACTIAITDIEFTINRK